MYDISKRVKNSKCKEIGESMSMYVYVNFVITNSHTKIACSEGKIGKLRISV